LWNSGSAGLAGLHRPAGNCGIIQN
jgi:hypothetical protein